MGLQELQQVTDLFVEGKECVLATDPLKMLWVNKLNPFEREEAQRDGQAARARVILSMKDLESPEYLIFSGSLTEMLPEDMRDALADSKANEFFLAAVDSIRSDPEWRDRMEARTRITPDMPEEEKAAVAKVDIDYGEELQKRLDMRRASYLAELAGEYDDARLRELYREAWLENRSFSAYQREFGKTQLFFGVRVCQGTRSDLGGYDHSACEGHRKRALDHRDEVAMLPDGLLTKLNETAQDLMMSGRNARFSGALASSSGSSAQPSEPEGSTPSTPEATSRELVTTSS